MNTQRGEKRNRQEEGDEKGGEIVRCKRRGMKKERQKQKEKYICERVKKEMKMEDRREILKERQLARNKELRKR